MHLIILCLQYSYRLRLRISYSNTSTGTYSMYSNLITYTVQVYSYLKYYSIYRVQVRYEYGTYRYRQVQYVLYECRYRHPVQVAIPVLVLAISRAVGPTACGGVIIPIFAAPIADGIL